MAPLYPSLNPEISRMAPPAAFTTNVRAEPTTLLLSAPLPRNSNVPASRMTCVAAEVGAVPRLFPKVTERTLLKVPLLKVPPVTVHTDGLAAVPNPELLVASESVPAPVLVRATPAAPARFSALVKVVVPLVVVMTLPVFNVSIPLSSEYTADVEGKPAGGLCSNGHRPRRSIEDCGIARRPGIRSPICRRAPTTRTADPGLVIGV